MLHVAHSLDAVHEEENYNSHGRKPTTQACFIADVRPSSEYHEHLVMEVLAQLSQ